MLYLWLKSLHLIFAIAWMSGLFYLPRFLVHSRNESNPETRKKLSMMAWRLYHFSHILMFVALGFGIAMLVVNSETLNQSWMHSKLLIVFLLIGYQHMTKSMLRRMDQNNMRSELFYRIYNEIPVLALVAIVLLAVLRP